MPAFFKSANKLGSISLVCSPQPINSISIDGFDLIIREKEALSNLAMVLADHLTVSF
jgi:hypothetical protein